MIIAGGGTGGHLYPGLALAEEIEKRWDAEITFIGTNYGIEARVLPKTHYGFKKIWMRGLRRKLSLSNLFFPFRLIISLAQCAVILLMLRPNVIIGTGGYVAGPALMMGIVFGIPTVIQEQNSYPGLVNRLLGKWVKQVHLTYEKSISYFNKRAHLFVSGNPVRGTLVKTDKSSALAKFQLRPSTMTLLVFGGSQGAHAINQMLLASLQGLLHETDLQLLWATGENDYEAVRQTTHEFGNRVQVLKYIEDMGSAYSAADLVLCRAGATTLAEIANSGLPSILVPYPYATANHQEYNARVLEAEGAALVLAESNWTPQLLEETVQTLASDNKKMKEMALAADKLARPNAASEIVDQVERLLKSS